MPCSANDSDPARDKGSNFKVIGVGSWGAESGFYARRSQRRIRGREKRPWFGRTDDNIGWASEEGDRFCLTILRVARTKADELLVP